MLVKAGQHKNHFVIDDVKERVRKPIQVRTPHLLLYSGVQVRIVGQEATGMFKLRQKGFAHANVTLVIPRKGFRCLKLRQWLENNLKSHA